MLKEFTAVFTIKLSVNRQTKKFTLTHSKPLCVCVFKQIMQNCEFFLKQKSTPLEIIKKNITLNAIPGEMCVCSLWFVEKKTLVN